MPSNTSKNEIICFDFKSILKEFGVDKSDVVLLSSDVMKLGAVLYRKERKLYNWNNLLDQIIEVIGDQGTLLLPTYNWGFCHGESFDWNKTPGQTGSLGNIALKRHDFKRTQHPIYSFAVWGKDKEELCNLDNVSSFGADSPFAYLERKHAKNVVIGLKFNEAYTFAHYVEQQSGYVTYRYEKIFTSSYINEKGIESVRNYSMFVRKLDIDVENDMSELAKEFYSKGIVQNLEIDSVSYACIDMTATVPYIMDDIIYNKGRKLCKYKGQ